MGRAASSGWVEGRSAEGRGQKPARAPPPPQSPHPFPQPRCVRIQGAPHLGSSGPWEGCLRERKGGWARGSGTLRGWGRGHGSGPLPCGLRGWGRAPEVRKVRAIGSLLPSPKSPKDWVGVLGDRAQ